LCEQTHDTECEERHEHERFRESGKDVVGSVLDDPSAPRERRVRNAYGDALGALDEAGLSTWWNHKCRAE